jgi:hypothetical protein
MNELNKTDITWTFENGGSVTFKDVDLENPSNFQSTGDMWYFEDGECYHHHYEDNASNSNN